MTRGRFLRIDSDDPTPIYAQLYRAIVAAISSGRLAEGEQLPTVRQLAVDLRINANTVAKVYAELERNQAVETRRGVGTFVKNLANKKNIHEADRKRELRGLVDQFVADAAARGFSLDEVLRCLASQR